jgi:hypothetical protein
MERAAVQIRILAKAPRVPLGMQAGTLPGGTRMPEPKISFQLIVDDLRAVGILVRTVRTETGHIFRFLLSRKTGLWVNCTAQEIIEHDIPTECLLPVGKLPESLEVDGD